jgi:hypothetical protein
LIGRRARQPCQLLRISDLGRRAQEFGDELHGRRRLSERLARRTDPPRSRLGDLCQDIRVFDGLYRIIEEFGQRLDAGQ